MGGSSKRVREAKRVARLEAARLRRIERRRKKAEIAPFARCGECLGLVTVVLGESGEPLGFERHRVPGSPDWCANGTKRVAPDSRRSIRAVSAGLPSLGQR